MDLCFSLHKLERFSSNPGKLHFGSLVYLFRYISYNSNLGLIYYARIKYAPLSDLLIQAIIKIDKKWMVFYDPNWQNYPYTDTSTGEYIVFYQGVTIDHCTHVSGPVAQYSDEIEYNATCTV